MRLFRPGIAGRWLYPGAIFRIRTEEKVLYLTFDDGPDPVSTRPLLEILEKNNVRCVFFCDGRAAEKNPELIALIKSKGHIIGNHGYSHPNGWRTKISKYLADAEKAEQFTSSTLFRPPYGRIGPLQFMRLKKKFRIVFWDIMSYDFDKSFGAERSIKIITENIRPGSVIALHDTSSSTANTFIGELITLALRKGYRFETFSF
jgi:peptidoglycan-N-acetylglucosamine deacetylase